MSEQPRLAIKTMTQDLHAPADNPAGAASRQHWEDLKRLHFLRTKMAAQGHWGFAGHLDKILQDLFKFSA